jgi:hypothetical protein
VAAGAAERLLTDSCAIAHSYADAHCVSPSHGSKLRLRAADLQRLRRSVAKSPGKSSSGVYLRASRLADWRFSFTAVSGQEVSRASATGDVVHAREKSYAAYADSNRTLKWGCRSIRTLHHWRISAMRGNGRYLRSSRVKKYPRATPLAIAGLLFALSRLSGFSRGKAIRRYLSVIASRVQDEPMTRSRVGCIWYPNWKVVIITASSASNTVPQVTSRFQVEI